MNDKPIAVVTGASGFVGSHLADLLKEKGYHVRCLLRKTSNRKWLEGKGFEFFDTGLFDKEGMRKAFEGASYIYHVAGVVKAKQPEGYFRGNVDTTRNILETALDFKDSLKRVLIVSSQTAVGPSYTEDSPVDETTEPHPITTYGRSKLEQERTAQSFMDRLPITICRAPAVYGERDTEIFIFFQTYKKGLMTTIGTDRKLVSLIHVTDLVEGFRLAAESEKAAGQTYFISSERFYTWDEIGDITGEVFGKKSFQVGVPHPIVFGIAGVAELFSNFSSKPATLNIEKARDITQTYWTCSTKKAMDDFGYRQNIDIREGVRRTVAWYKQMGWI